MYYVITEEIRSLIENESEYHQPKNDQAERYELLRSLASAFKLEVIARTPPSKEQDNALKAIDEATFWSNAAIARNE